MRDECKGKETLLIKDWEKDKYVTCNIFLKYIDAKCNSKIKKYVKIKTPVVFNV